MSKPVKKVISIILSLAMMISLLPVMNLPALALSVAGTLSFTGSELPRNCQTSKIYDGGNFNGIICSDIPNIQLDIFGANSYEEAMSGTATGGVLYTPKDSVSVTYGGILTVADTVQDGLGDDASIPKILVIKSSDGTDFSLQSIYVGAYIGSNSPIRFTGYLNGNSTGFCDLVINTSTYEETFALNASLPQSVFENVDMVLITNSFDGNMTYCNYALFNHIEIGDPVVHNTAPTFVGGATGTLTAHAGQTDVKPLLHVSDSDSGQTLIWSQISGPAHGTLEMNSGTPQASSNGTDIIPGGTILYTPESGYTGTDSFTIQVSDGVTNATKTITVNADTDEVMTFVENEFKVNDNQPPVSKPYKGVPFLMTPAENNYTTIYDHPPFSGLYALDWDSIDDSGTKFTISALGYSFDLNSFMYYADNQNPTLTITATTVDGSPITLTYPTNISTGLQEGTYSLDSLAGQFDDLASVTFSSSIYTTFNNFHITDIRSLFAPEIDVQGNDLSIASGDTTPSSTDGTDFGGIGVSGGSVQRTFTILNTGTEALTLSGTPLISISGTNASDFSVAAFPTSPVTASGSTNFTITFAPTTTGTRTATVTIANNDDNEGSYNFTIQGTGLSSNAALSGGTVKGQTPILGMPSSNLSTVTEGSVSLTIEQAADTTGGGAFITSFGKADASSTVKVVKYPEGITDFSGFDGASAYDDEAVSNGDIFIVKVTSEDATVNYYKIVATIVQAPVLSINTGLAIDEGTEAIIMASHLSATDADTANTALVYTIQTSPANGILKKSGSALAAGGIFTQDDIDNSRVTYTHDGSETSIDSFTFTVSDGTNSLPVQTFSITVVPVNDAPFTRDITSFLQLGAKAGSKSANGSYATSQIDNITLETWIYLTDTAGAHHVLFNGNGASSGYGFYVSGQTVNILLGFVGWIVSSSGASYNAANSAVLTVGRWTHIAATRNTGDGGTYGWKIYVDGQPLPTQFNPAGGALGRPNALNTSSYVQIGSSNDDPAGLSISEARIWNRALSQSEIQANMSGTVATNAAGLVGYWKLAHNSGTTIADIQTNQAALNLPVTGPITWVPSTVGRTEEDMPLSGRLAGGDIETSVTYAKASDPAHGTVTVDANGAYTYTPAADFNGNDSFTFVTNDGSLDSESRTVNITVIPINDAPTLSAGPYTLAGTNEDTTSSSVTISEILTGLNEQDVDGNTLGIALTGKTGNGNWQYSTDGYTWMEVGMVSANASLLLSPSTQLRYVPDGKNGETSTLAFRAWDQTLGTATLNGIRSTANTTTNGGSTIFSAVEASAKLIVSSANDAPVLTPTSPSLTSITTGQTGNVGQTVSSFASGTISDVDTGALKGIAIVATTNGSGKWQFSTDNGGSWVDVGVVSQSNALLLRDIDKVRFVPGSPDATMASITYHAWDRTSSSQGSKADVTTYGGTTDFSTATDTASITVSAESSVINVSSTTYNGVYKAGDEIVIIVQFDKVVTVTGTPRLTLKLDENDRNIDYFSGSGTDTLSFTYTVQPGDSSSNLDYADTDVLMLDSGTIQTGGADVSLILPAPGSAGSLGANKNITIDGVEPIINSVSVPAAGMYKTGATLNFYVNFNETVTVNTLGGTPYLTLGIGSETRNAAYFAGSGTGTLIFSYIIQSGDLDDNGISVGILSLNSGTISDEAGNDTTTILNHIDSTSGILVDAIAPTVSSIVRHTPVSEHTNTSALTFRITFNEPVENVSADDFNLTFAGTTDGTIASVSAFSGSVIDINVNGISGDGTLRLDLKNGTDISDAVGNTAGGYMGGEAYTIDKTAPVPGDSGDVASSNPTRSSVNLTWTAASDTVTANDDLQYKVVYSTSNNISNLSDALSNGTSAKDWTADLMAFNVTGLSAGTNYYFSILVKDAAGNTSAYTVATARTLAHSSGGSPSSSGNNNAEVIVNGQSQTAGTSVTSTNAIGQTVTTVTVDTEKLINILSSQGTGATVTVPIINGSEVAAGTLTGAMVKSMEDKDAILVIQTSSASYTLPASEINIDTVSEQLGTSVSLADINVTVSISEPSASMVQIVENAALDGGYTLMVPAVDYTITCTFGSQTVNVSSFSNYVERTIALPNGVDPTKITTGVVVDSDGTVHHVPTRVVIIDGKYYAVINSLTNSTYSVIWNPVEFSDVASHWAKDAINNMGSRMVVTGIGNNQYAPDRSMTRAEFAIIIVRALGLAPGTGASGFSDIASTDRYSGYIKTAAAFGIIKGYGNGNFGPNDTITREQAMTMLARAMKITGLDAGLTEHEVGKLLSAYSDGSVISTYAQISVAACLKTGITYGTSATTISPKAAITRAEIAVMVERLLKKSRLI